eukprot:20481_1
MSYNIYIIKSYNSGYRNLIMENVDYPHNNRLELARAMDNQFEKTSKIKQQPSGNWLVKYKHVTGYYNLDKKYCRRSPPIFELMRNVFALRQWRKDVSLLLIAAKQSLKHNGICINSDSNGITPLQHLENKLKRKGMAELHLLTSWHNMSYKDKAKESIYSEYHKLKRLYVELTLRGKVYQSYIHYKKKWRKKIQIKDGIIY